MKNLKQQPSFLALIATILLAANAYPQQAASAPSTNNLVFQVATIKPSQKIGQPIIRPTMNGISARNVTLRDLVKDAYRADNFADERVLGIPDWASTIQYDLEARIEDSELASFGRLGSNERYDQLILRLRTLLADRFQLKMHMGSVSVPVFKLVAGSPTKVLEEAGPPNPEFPSGELRSGLGFITAKGVQIGLLVTVISRRVGRPVIDESGLKGKYNFAINWTLDERPSAALDSAAPTPYPLQGDDDKARMIAAIEKNLGLKLVNASAPMPTIIVDEAHRPTAN